MNDAALSDPWLALAVAVFVLAVLSIALFARREVRPAASTDAKLDALSVRIKVVEEAQKVTDHDVRNVRMIVANLPSKESIAKLAEQLAESRGVIGGMQNVLTSQSRSLDRIEDWLMRTSADAIVQNAGKAGKPSGDPS